MKHTQYRWWVLAVSIITQLCAALSTQGIGVFAGFLQHDFALSNSEVGVLASTLNIAPIFGLLFIGGVLDVFGERWLIFLGMVTISIAMIFMSLSTHYWMLLIMLFFCGVGYSPIQPGGSKAIYTWFTTAQQRGFAMGIRQAALPLGGALSAIIFPYIIYRSDWRHAICFISLLILVGGALFFLVYRDTVQPSSTKRNLSFRYVLNILHQKYFRRIAIIGIVLVSIQTFILVFWILFIQKQFHIPLIEGTQYLLAIQLFGAIGRILLSVLGSNIKGGYPRILLITILMLIILLISIPFFPSNTNVWQIIFFSCCLGFFGFGWYGPWIVWLSNETLTKNVGAVLSVSMALNQIAIVITPCLFGIILDFTKNYTASWICLAALASTTLIILRNLSCNG